MPGYVAGSSPASEEAYVEADVAEQEQVAVCEPAGDGYAFHVDECPVRAAAVFHEDFLVRDANDRVMTRDLGSIQTDRHSRQTAHFVVAHGKRKGLDFPFQTHTGFRALPGKCLRGVGGVRRGWGCRRDDRALRRR